MNIRKIAKICKVSPSTVSRVINNPELVASATKNKILSTINDKKYCARKYSKKSEKKIIYFIFSIEDYNFYEGLYQGLDSVFGTRNINTVLSPLMHNDKRLSEQIDAICNSKCDGVIWAVRDLHIEELEKLINKNIPIVLSRKYKNAPTILPDCYTDFTYASSKMTQFLINNNHKVIYQLVEKVSYQFVSSFCGGFKNVCLSNSLKYNDDWIINTENSADGGYITAKKLLSTNKKPDALFCASNEMAYGAIKAAKDLKLNIPNDISIVGFTDSKIAKLCDPPLTTIDQSIEELGILSAQTLLQLIETPNETALRGQKITLQPKLCIRKSCKIINE